MTQVLISSLRDQPTPDVGGFINPEPVLAFVGGKASLNAILIAMLRAGGFRVLEACDGIAAIALITRRDCLALVTTLDVADLSGPELLLRAKTVNNDLPVFVVAERQATSEELSAILQADGVFQKPLKGSAMVEAIRTALSRSGKISV